VVEVAGFVPQHKVFDIPGTCSDVFSEASVFPGKHYQPADDQAGNQHDDQRWKDSANPTLIEIGQQAAKRSELVFLGRLDQYSGDQVTADDKEDVNADEATGQVGR
jgi:hypothetical protein